MCDCKVIHFLYQVRELLLHCFFTESQSMKKVRSSVVEKLNLNQKKGKKMLIFGNKFQVFYVLLTLVINCNKLILLVGI